MSYVRSKALGQLEDLLVATPEEIAALPPGTRIELAFRREEMRAHRSAALWTALAAASPVLISIAAFCGFSLFASRKD